jgi:hypothetical protein
MEGPALHGFCVRSGDQKRLLVQKSVSEKTQEGHDPWDMVPGMLLWGGGTCNARATWFRLWGRVLISVMEGLHLAQQSPLEVLHGFQTGISKFSISSHVTLFSSIFIK